MNWEAIGAVGEVVGGLGVIFTLGYLALQIRQNTRSLKSASYQSAISSMSEVAGSIYNDEEVSRIVYESLRGNEASDLDQYRFETFLTRLFRNFENFYYQHEAGVMEDHLWNGMKNSMLGYYHLAPVRSWWESRKETYSVQFDSFLENEPENSGAFLKLPGSKFEAPKGHA
jgi:hypothetical protein